MLDGIYKETSDYVAQYLKDKYGLITSGEEVLRKYPWHEIVWEGFFAHAFYKVKDYYVSWDDVPEPFEGMCAYIVKADVMERRMFKNGAWSDLGSDHPACYK